MIFCQKSRASTGLEKPLGLWPLLYLCGISQIRKLLVLNCILSEKLGAFCFSPPSPKLLIIIAVLELLIVKLLEINYHYSETELWCLCRAEPLSQLLHGANLHWAEEEAGRNADLYHLKGWPRSWSKWAWSSNSQHPHTPAVLTIN